MRSTRLFAAAILAVSGLVAVGATTESAQAASSKDLTVQYGAKVVANEKFTASGRLSTHTPRTVRLQYRTKSSGPWSTRSGSVSSNSGGYFTFSGVTTSKSRYFRFVAPSGGGLSTITGNAKRVTVVSQKVTSATLISESSCHFGASGSGTSSNVSFYGKFYPARPGRQVNLITQSAGTLTMYEDAQGEVAGEFNPGNVNGSYTAVATAQPTTGGLAAKSSRSMTYNVFQCLLIPI